MMYSMEELCALVNVKCVRGRHDEAEAVIENSESSEEDQVDSGCSDSLECDQVDYDGAGSAVVITSGNEGGESVVEDSSIGEMEDALDSSWTLKLEMENSPGAAEFRGGVEHDSNVYDFVENEGVEADNSSGEEDALDLTWTRKSDQNCDPPGAAESGYEGEGVEHDSDVESEGVKDDHSSGEEEDALDLTWTPNGDQNGDSPDAAESGYEGGGVEHDSNVEGEEGVEDDTSGEDEDPRDRTWTPERDHNVDSPGESESGNEDLGVEVEEDSSCGDAGLGRPRKRRNPETWKNNIQKRRRMSGKSYLGRKNRESVLKEERKMGLSCQSAACHKSTKLHCREAEESKREEIFKYFWEKLDWRERKIYVKSLVEVSSVKRRRTGAEKSRRSASIFCHLVVDGRRLRVCQRMFLSTLGLKQWSFLKWIGRRGKSPSEGNKKRVTVRREEVDFLKTFLLNLPKVPSHYCRSSSSKMYLEPVFKSINHLHAEYTRSSAEDGVQALSRQVFTRTFKDLNLSLFHPKKDQCDTCCAFKAGNIDAATWKEHCTKKDTARAMKQKDKEEAGEKTLVTCMDLQGLLLCPKLQASSLYFKTKLCVHNFTIYEMTSHDASNYLWHEGEAGISANEFASCIVHFLKEHPSYEEYILWSDGCGYQNRNLLLSNALLKFATETQKTVTQKYLERGHTQMECDSVHSVIERRLRNRDICVPAEYVAAIRGARSNPRPYHVKYVDHTFFTNFSHVNLCKSIRPGKVAGDPTVHDLRAIRYNVDSSMEYKINHSDAWKPYESPSLRKKSNITKVAPLYTSRHTIKALKFKHLQEMKLVLPKDFHGFYDGLRHEE